MNNLYEKAEAARHFIQNAVPSISLDSCIVTGTGLGELWKDMEIISTIDYNEIPHFSKNTVQSHAGKLFICKHQGKNVAILSGRFHFYEGYKAAQVAFPIRVMHLLGVSNLLITNVAGGLNEDYSAGSIVAVTDHINIQPDHVLRGSNDERFGKRFTDMLRTYNLQVIENLEIFAKNQGINLHRGVYLALQGPSLETPAEYKYLKTIGADLVGMSSVPEAIAASHMAMKITTLSVVSNVCWPLESITETTVEEVIAVANKTIPKLNILMKQWIEIS
ncbi:purine-nucleoside phosphorylase [Saprospiraceae bacterium]|nr:purine-nucleoside phosphorylase [Saprospiraceae bacterium]